MKFIFILNKDKIFSRIFYFFSYYIERFVLDLLNWVNARLNNLHLYCRVPSVVLHAMRACKYQSR